MLLTFAVIFSSHPTARLAPNVMPRLTRFSGPPAAASLSSRSQGAGIGLPARIVCAEGLAAQAVTRHGACALGLAHTGPLPAGAWVLASGGAARAVIDSGRARAIDAALDLLDAVARGDLDEALASGCLARYFAIVSRHADI